MLKDAFSPPFVLMGQGFGPNLADKYGFQAGGAFAGQELRNAHNSHVTLLARTGLPLTILWSAIWGTLFSLMRTSGRASSHGSPQLLRAWLAAATAGILLNAVFDPVIEGPQVGIIVWTLAGLASHHAGPRRTRDHFHLFAESPALGR